MDFLDPKQKRKHNIKLFVGYGLMAALVIISTILIAYISSGYYYDAKTKTVVQNGLLFVDSHPESARILLNGQDKGETDNRLVLPSGSYKVELVREGYRTWTHNVGLEGGRIERLVYPFMFPTDLISSDADLFSSKPIFSSQSPDRRWLVIKQAESINSFGLVDLEADSKEPQLKNIDASLLVQTGKKHTFVEIEWSTDNRHLLVRHDHDTGSEFLVLDREDPAKTVNLNTSLKRTFTTVRLRDKKFDKYYLHDSKTLELVSSDLSGAVAVVANRVLNFQPHGKDMVLYAASTADKDSVEVRLVDGDKTHKIRDIPKSPKYLLDLAQFDGKWYVAFGSSEDKKVYIYKDPLADLNRENQKTPQASVLLRLSGPVEYLSLSNNTRFISIQSGPSFAVYDAETLRQYKFDTKLNLPKNYKVEWMDGHRLTAVSDSKLVVFDFDGTNKQTLVQTYGEFHPYFDRDYSNLYSISPSTVVKNRSALVLTPMIYKAEKTN